MFLIPLTQSESVALVIHALRVAGGEADCSTCPVRKVCMKQCLTIAESLDRMVLDGSLPTVGEPEAQTVQDPPAEPSKPKQAPPGPGHLKIIK